MSMKIPFSPGLLLGHTVSFKDALLCGKTINHNRVHGVEQVNKMSSRFSVVKTFEDVCNIFSVPQQYALKVAAGFMNDPAVEACLEDIDNDNAFTVVVCTEYVQKNKFVKEDDSVSCQFDGSEGQGCDLHCDTTSKDCPFKNTVYWVRALEVGQKLVTIMQLQSKDPDLLEDIIESWNKYMQTERGHLKDGKMDALNLFAKKWNKKMQLSSYREFLTCNIKCFHDADVTGRFTTLPEWIKVMADFQGVCDAQLNTHLEAKDEKTEAQFTSVEGRKTDVSKKEVESKQIPESSPRTTPGGSDFLHNDSELCSNLHATLSALKTERTNELEDNVCTDAASTDTPECINTTSTDTPKDTNATSVDTPKETLKFHELFQLLLSSRKVLEETKDFKKTEIVEYGQLEVEVERQKEAVEQFLDKIKKVIRDLDLTDVPPKECMEHLISDCTLTKVTSFNETASSTLPQGPPLNLLIIGNQGHGKSSSGNSILNEDTFQSTSSLSSEIGAKCESREIDGRTITVVDTTGVCNDTSEVTDGIVDIVAESIIRDAFILCKSFHALLLNVRYGTRMTLEERDAIKVLKNLFGENVMKEHGICLVTFGNNFESMDKVKGQDTFLDWCKKQKGFLETLFRECDYRCVLFDNVTKEINARKRQRIKLIHLVDRIFHEKGKCYAESDFLSVNKENLTIMQEVNDGSLTKIDSESLTKVDDGSLTKVDGESLTKVDGESLTKVDGESLTKVDGESLTKVDGESLTKVDDGSLTKVDGVSLTKVDDESLTQVGDESLAVMLEADDESLPVMVGIDNESLAGMPKEDSGNDSPHSAESASYWQSISAMVLSMNPFKASNESS